MTAGLPSGEWSTTWSGRGGTWPGPGSRCRYGWRRSSERPASSDQSGRPVEVPWRSATSSPNCSGTDQTEGMPRRPPVRDLVGALVEGDQGRATAIIDTCLRRLQNRTDLFADLIQPTLYAIGDMW